MCQPRSLNSPSFDSRLSLLLTRKNPASSKNNSSLRYDSEILEYRCGAIVEPLHSTTRTSARDSPCLRRAAKLVPRRTQRRERGRSRQSRAGRRAREADLRRKMSPRLSTKRSSRERRGSPQVGSQQVNRTGRRMSLVTRVSVRVWFCHSGTCILMYPPERHILSSPEVTYFESTNEFERKVLVRRSDRPLTVAAKSGACSGLFFHLHDMAVQSQCYFAAYEIQGLKRLRRLQDSRLKAADKQRLVCQLFRQERLYFFKRHQLLFSFEELWIDQDCRLFIEPVTARTKVDPALSSGEETTIEQENVYRLGCLLFYIVEEKIPLYSKELGPKFNQYQKKLGKLAISCISISRPSLQQLFSQVQSQGEDKDIEFGQLGRGYYARQQIDLVRRSFSKSLKYKLSQRNSFSFRPRKNELCHNSRNCTGAVAQKAEQRPSSARNKLIKLLSESIPKSKRRKESRRYAPRQEELPHREYKLAQPLTPQCDHGLQLISVRPSRTRKSFFTKIQDKGVKSSKANDPSSGKLLQPRVKRSCVLKSERIGPKNQRVSRAQDLNYSVDKLLSKLQEARDEQGELSLKISQQKIQPRQLFIQQSRKQQTKELNQQPCSRNQAYKQKQDTEIKPQKIKQPVPVVRTSEKTQLTRPVQPPPPQKIVIPKGVRTGFNLFSKVSQSDVYVQEESVQPLLLKPRQKQKLMSDIKIPLLSRNKSAQSHSQKDQKEAPSKQARPGHSNAGDPRPEQLKQALKTGGGGQTQAGTQAEVKQTNNRLWKHLEEVNNVYYLIRKLEQSEALKSVYEACRPLKQLFMVGCFRLFVKHRLLLQRLSKQQAADSALLACAQLTQEQLGRWLDNKALRLNLAQELKDNPQSEKSLKSLVLSVQTNFPGAKGDPVFSQCSCVDVLKHGLSLATHLGKTLEGRELRTQHKITEASLQVCRIEGVALRVRLIANPPQSGLESKLRLNLEEMQRIVGG